MRSPSSVQVADFVTFVTTFASATCVSSPCTHTLVALHVELSFDQLIVTFPYSWPVAFSTNLSNVVSVFPSASANIFLQALHVQYSLWPSTVHVAAFAGVCISSFLWLVEFIGISNVFSSVYVLPSKVTLAVHVRFPTSTHVAGITFSVTVTPSNAFVLPLLDVTSAVAVLPSGKNVNTGFPQISLSSAFSARLSIFCP